MPQQSCAVILAAGEGKRMKRNRPKCLSPVLFKPMLQWVVDSARAAGIANICAVTGFQSGQVNAYLAEHDPDVSTVLQKERKGTGHAVMAAADFFRSRASGGNVLVLNGDAPFLDPESIRKAYQQHTECGSSVTVISAFLEDPTGYGRILRSRGGGDLRAIVEQKDASEAEKAIQEVNSGAYWFRTDDLLETLPQIRSDNKQGEYYLTDAVGILLSHGKKAGAFAAEGPDAVKGANDCLQLHELNVIARETVLARHMRAGVDIPCTDGVVIGPDVVIGRDCTVLPGTLLYGCTVIDGGCTLGPGTVLDGCSVGSGCVLDSVRGKNCTVKPETHAGPFTEICTEE